MAKLFPYERLKVLEAALQCLHSHILKKRQRCIVVPQIHNI